MAYLFRPPQRTERVRLAGQSLYYSYQVSLSVWKDVDGNWVSGETPSTDDIPDPDAYYFTPAIIPNVVAAELIAAGIGECIPIEA